jgi:hypothetical protein
MLSVCKATGIPTSVSKRETEKKKNKSLTCQNLRKHALRRKGYSRLAVEKALALAIM